MEGAFRTVAGRGRAAFEVRGSEFIGHAAPARTTEEAEAFVAEVGAEHADATHNVPAYRVRVGDGGGGMIRAWSSDDGEPAGSAGKPALNVLVQRDIENVAVVVTRYYGGTNLGVGGLARAYSRAAKGAVDYGDSGTVRSILESEGVEFEADYEERVRFSVWAPTADAGALCDRLRSATGGRAEVER